MPAGAPSKYDHNPQTKESEPGYTVEKTREYLENYKDSGDVIPSVAGLAIVLKVSRKSIYNWSADADKEEFLHILEEILATQESLLMNKGLSNEFNANIVKLALGKHGYADKKEVEVSENELTPWDSMSSRVDE